MHGFRVDSVTALPDLRALAYEATHAKTGARLCHVHCHDPENLFSVGFRAPVPDTTGIAHVLEHCVLAGSEKYPVKDAFGELGNRSLCTSNNATTLPDHTVYEVSSPVRADLFNLADVFLDLVFHPLLSQATFQREGHHLALLDPQDPSRGLTVSGVVYNEMRAYFDRPDWFVLNMLRWHLSPDRPEAVDAGGDPARIPDLRHEDLVAFHRRYYVPSNARFMLYGDIPLAEHLAFLEAALAPYDRVDVETDYPPQPAWPAPRRLDLPYPAPPGESLEGRGFVVVAWLLCEARDIREMLTLAIAIHALAGSDASPLRQALVASKLGANLFPERPFYPDADPWPWDYRQALVAIGLRGCDPADGAAVESVLLAALDQVARDGLAAELIDAAFNSVSFYAREVTSSFPVELMFRHARAWFYGDDPSSGLRAAQILEALRAEYAEQPRLFDEAVDRWLLHNPHRLTVTAYPDPELALRQSRAFRARMDTLAAAMGPAGLARVQAEAEALGVSLSAPESPKALATLPRLAIGDVPRQARTIPAVETRLGDVEVLEHPVFSNGILYVGLAFDTVDLGDEESALLPLLGTATLGLGTATQDHRALALRLARHTGGVQARPFTGRRLGGGARFERLAIDVKLLPREADALVSIVKDVLFCPLRTAPERLRDLVREAASQAGARLSRGGAVLAVQHAAASLGADAWRESQWTAASQYALLTGLGRALDEPEQAEDLGARLEALRRRLFVRARIQISLAGDPELLPPLRTRLAAMLADLPPGEPAAPDRATVPPLPAFTGVELGGRTGSAAMVFRVPDLAHPAAPALDLLTSILADMVWRRVRNQGGTYGGTARYLSTRGLLGMASTSDPDCAATLRAFREAAASLDSGAIDDQALDAVRVGAIGGVDTILGPAEQLETARAWHWIGLTDAQRQAFREGLFSVNAADVRRDALPIVQAGMAAAGIAVLGPRSILEAAGSIAG